MNAIDALARLQSLGIPIIETGDAAAVLGEETSAASHTLARLGAAGLVHRVRHGVWWIDGEVDPLRLAGRLTHPFDSYVSLHTALHVHGLIEQIPDVVYAVTQARTQRIATTVGAFSYHHVVPVLFGGYEDRDGVWLATAEKAVFDVAWLSAGRSRLFAALPEVDLPRGFRRSELDRWIAKVPTARGRTRVARALARFGFGSR